MAETAAIHLPAPAPGVGTYSYRLNGEATGVEETFEVAADSTLIRSTRAAPGATLLSVTIERADEHNARCTISFRTDSVPLVQADYLLEDGRLAVIRTNEPGLEEVDPAAGILSPLMRVFQGPAIAETIRSGGECPVVVPALDPGSPSTLLAPTVQLRSAERLGVEAVGEGEQEALWRRCRYVGGNYDDSADFWLDEHDRLVRYRFPQAADQLWEVDLITADA